jgi:hypothetical protein
MGLVLERGADLAFRVRHAAPLVEEVPDALQDLLASSFQLLGRQATHCFRSLRESLCDELESRTLFDDRECARRRRERCVSMASESDRHAREAAIDGARGKRRDARDLRRRDAEIEPRLLARLTVAVEATIFGRMWWPSFSRTASASRAVS